MCPAGKLTFDHKRYSKIFKRQAFASHALSSLLSLLLDLEGVRRWGREEEAWRTGLGPNLRGGMQLGIRCALRWAHWGHCAF